MARRHSGAMVRQRPKDPSYATQWARSFANILPSITNTALQSTVQGLIQDAFTGKQQQRDYEARATLGEESRAAAEQAAQQSRMHEKEMGLRKIAAKKDEDLIGTLSQAFGLAEQPEVATELLTKGREFRRPAPMVPRETTEIGGTEMPTFGALPEEPPEPLGFQGSVQEAMSGWSPGQRKEASYAFGRTSPMQDAIKLARIKGEETRKTVGYRHPLDVEKIGRRGGEQRKTAGFRGRVTGKLKEQEQGAGAEKVKQEKAYLHPAVKYQVEPGYEPKTVPYEPPGPAGERRRGYTPGRPAAKSVPKPSRATPGAKAETPAEARIQKQMGITPKENADLLELDNRQRAKYNRARKTVDDDTGRPFTHERALQFALGRR